MNKQNLKKVYFQLFIAAFFWGGASIAAKVLMTYASPCVATFSRYAGAAFILLFVIRLRNSSENITFTDHIKLAIIGIVGITLCYYFYFCGLKLSSTYNAALFEATTPLLTFLLSLILRKEKFDLAQLMGLIIAYIGIIVITAQGSLSNLIQMHFNFGDILLLLSTICFAIYNVLFKNLKIEINESLKTYYIFLYGAIGLVPWLISDINSKGKINLAVTPTSIACILFLALGSSVISYLLFNKGIAAIGASKASECINLVPVITIILTVVVLHTMPVSYQIIGAVIILIGMVISKIKLP